ncbi:putative hydrolase of the HAD superfamily [Ruminococcus sp. YE71]|uniref:HAD family hydrolase n=1 Tax=unclassified Ruminococcus TaxID=2608920 RepID=UPI00088C20C6|nr:MULTISPECIES: HAD-IA family hydrolase [unclassified Ruminococcus]SDA10161.1 putative hydrolase of the HAD superfamily [Ruminococcus sp. YE78]SFW11048.1 putative hydrolase of the HAD superfamily [Ruminococcus sp. YE71]
MIKAAFFDIDDTLYAYHPCDNAAVLQMHRVFMNLTGRKCTKDQFDKMLSDAKKYVKENTANTAACHNRMLYAQRLCEIGGCFSAENVLALYNAYWDTFLGEMQLYENVAEVFSMLKSAGIRIGFCTDLTAHIQMRKLVRLGISDIADAVVTSEESGIEKPAPRSFQLLLGKLGVEPEQVVMIGDDHKKDIVGAAALGMKTIMFGGSGGDTLHAADFYELEAIFREMIE